MLDEQLIASTITEIKTLREELFQAREKVDSSHPRYQSLLNLEQYMILRNRDRTELQEKLFLLSLSSLGRSYAHVAASIDTLYDQLSSSLECTEIPEEVMKQFHHVTIEEAIKLASANATALFGGKTAGRFSKQSTAVMVTLPSHAAENEGALIHELADAGVQVFRINTAHDSQPVWQAMADVIHRINKERKANDVIKIFVDLAGPKIRTGEIQKLPLPVEIGSNKAHREVYILPEVGVTHSAQKDPVTLTTIPAQICVENWFFKKLKVDKRVRVHDANFKKATITVTEIGEEYAKGIIDKKVYLDEASTLQRKHNEAHVINLARQTEPIRLHAGDRLVITEREVLGHAAVTDKDGNVIKPATISCSFDGISSLVKEGDPIYIDDGKIGLQVLSVDDRDIVCDVINAKINGTLLKAEKGINLPDTHIRTSAVTERDKSLLDGVLAFADMLGLSFCQSGSDVVELQRELEQRNRTDVGIIAKIETQHAVKHMPDILRQLLESQHSGVMIARGDLAIEVGFASLASVQEKLLDICDAAHMPVIWATQVLESKMKNNLPSRAEVTDAAMSGRAECVMLNKGMFAVDTIDTLKHILHDMHLMFKKNRQLLSKETLWNEI
jgi:pyruvate kinase